MAVIVSMALADSIGIYGGTWKMIVDGDRRVVNVAQFTDIGLLMWNREQNASIPGIAESWEVLDDGRQFVIKLRKGHRWSDGEPFTADDVLFWWEDIFMNDELLPVKHTYFKSADGNVGRMEKIDDVLKEMENVPFGNSAFQNEHLTDGQETPERRYRFALLQLHRLIPALKACEFRRERIGIDIEKLIRRLRWAWGYKRRVLKIDRAEKETLKLSNAGYNLIEQNGGLEKTTFIYSK